jgi:hypothetical protein
VRLRERLTLPQEFAMSTSRLACLLLGGFAACLATSAAWTDAAQAQDFRIDTEVFIGAEKEPAAETLTLFASGLVYDFLLGTEEEITLLDTQRGRLTLIDPVRKVKAGLATQDVLDYVLALESHAVASKQPLFAFAASPTFETAEQEVEQNGQKLMRLKFTGAPLVYEVLASRAHHPQAVVAYRSFADWHARLNALRPGNLPPGARLEVNKAMAEKHLLPLEVKRTIPAATPIGKTLEVRSRHLVNWSLSGEDRKRIDRAGTYLASFQQVSFDEYRSPAAKPAAKTVRR